MVTALLPGTAAAGCTDFVAGAAAEGPASVTTVCKPDTEQIASFGALPCAMRSFASAASSGRMGFSATANEPSSATP